MSLPMLDRWILSRWERVIAAAHAANPEVKIGFHSDGRIGEAIPRMLEIGVIDPDFWSAAQNTRRDRTPYGHCQDLRRDDHHLQQYT